MPISQFETYHGAVLTQVIRNPHVSLKLVGQDENSNWGEYSVCDNTGDHVLYIKHCGSVRRGRRDEEYCNFTFNINDLKRLSQAKKDCGKAHVAVALVCGHNEICLITARELEQLELGEHSSHNIKVAWGKNKRFRVTGPGGIELNFKPTRNRLKGYFH